MSQKPKVENAMQMLENRNKFGTHTHTTYLCPSPPLDTAKIVSSFAGLVSTLGVHTLSSLSTNLSLHKPASISASSPTGTRDVSLSDQYAVYLLSASSAQGPT